MAHSRSLRKHHGVRALFLVQIFSTLSYSVLFSTLVLYMTKQLKLNDIDATSITANFVAFNYALHLVGGFISGRLFSHRSLFVLGMLLQVIGCILISFLSLYSLLWGLAFFLSGSGLNVTCINCMLTQFFEPHEKRRETAFLWNYSAMNVGFLIGFTVGGIFELSQNYRELFLLSGFANFLSIIVLFFHWKYLFDRNTYFADNSIKQRWLFRFYGALLLLAIIISLKWLVKFSFISNNLILITGVAMAFVIIFIALRQKKKKTAEKIWAYLILGAMSLVFWSLYMMAPMGLILFIENNVHRSIFHFIIPPQWVQNINTLIIIFGGPTLAHLYTRLRKRGVNITIPIQFSVALFLIAVAFIILPVGIHFADHQGMVNFGWIVACYFLQSVGELFISPIGYAMVGQLIPSKLQGLMMGTWMMISGVAAILANLFSKMALGYSDQTNPLITNPSFAKTFNILGWGAFSASIIMLCLIKFLHKLIKEKSDPNKTTAYPL